MGNCQGTQAVMTMEPEVGQLQKIQSKDLRKSKGESHATLDTTDVSYSSRLLGLSSSRIQFPESDESSSKRTDEDEDHLVPLKEEDELMPLPAVERRNKEGPVRRSRQSMMMACIASGMDPAEVLELLKACQEEEDDL